ncbi:MAG TPA: hypothetical protein VF525_00920 [Pyrinomonadaceae bacterium]|jgi:hypothetical protein
MNSKRTKVLCVMLWLICLSATAFGVCNQAQSSQAERDLWNEHGCWQDFFLWQYLAYGVRSGDWSNRGYFDACNVNLEYPKHWNASYLLTYKLNDNLAQSWHGTIDYRATAEAASSNFHNSIYHQATDDTSIYGAFNPPDQVQTSCLLYDNNKPSANNNPASRAGDYMHEGWHAWFRRYGYNGGGGSCGHFTGPQGACTMDPCGCDYFYFHGVGAYAFGAMWENNGTASRFHSPNQVQVEFLCDIADQSSAPASVKTAARADANARANGRFINGPGYRCGDPRPW